MECKKCQYLKTETWENMIFHQDKRETGNIPYVERFIIETYCTQNNGITCPYND